MQQSLFPLSVFFIGLKMAPFLIVPLLLILTFNVHSDIGHFAVVTKVECTDAACCSQCEPHRSKTVLGYVLSMERFVSVGQLYVPQ